MWVAIAIVLSGCVKLCLLGSRELWLDETYSTFEARLAFTDLLRFASGDVHPPLFAFLLWLWVHLCGDDTLRLRLFSVLLNIWSMIAMFALARRALGIRFSILATTLFAFSPMMFVYSMEVRSYTLFTLVFVHLLHIHWIAAVEKDDSYRVLLVYGLLAATLFYTHYIALFLLSGLFVHWLLNTGYTRRRMSRLVITGGIILLLATPGALLLKRQHRLKAELDQHLQLSHEEPKSLSFDPGHPEGVQPSSLLHLAESISVDFGVWPTGPRAIVLLCAIPLLAAGVSAALLAVFKRDEACQCFVLVSFALISGLALLHLSNPRYVLPLIPLTALAFARVVQDWLTSDSWRRMGIIFGTLIVCLYLAGFYRQATKRHGRPWGDMVALLKQRYRPGDEVVFDVLYAQIPFDYFAEHQHFTPQETGFPVPIYDWWKVQKHTGWGGPVVMRSDLNQFVAGRSAEGTIWLVSYETNYYDPRESLLASFRQIAQVDEVPLPDNPDTQGTRGQEDLRLFRVVRKGALR